MVDTFDDLNNFVKVKLSASETQPGQNVSIDVITHPDSYVGLIGIDQSVLLLKKNDGLTKEDVFNEMNSYQNSNFGGYRHYSTSTYSLHSDVFQIWTVSGLHKCFENHLR